MKNLSDINVVKSLLSRHGFQFAKALGQNFLINPEICPKMATECGADPALACSPENWQQGPIKW